MPDETDYKKRDSVFASGCYDDLPEQYLKSGGRRKENYRKYR